MSKYLGRLGRRGFLRAADLLVPGVAGFPRFSETPWITQIDRVMDFMTPEDRSGFVVLMGVFAYLPRVLLRSLLTAPVRAGLVAQIQIGVKGAVYALAFSDLTADESVRAFLSYDTYCGEQPREKSRALLAPGLPARAMAEARRAAPVLRALSVHERLAHVARLRAVIVRHRESIIDEIVRVTGKSRGDALMSEVFPVLDHLDFLRRHGERGLKPQAVPTPIALLGKKSRVEFEPMGVVLSITPWNYPFYQMVVPATTALVCGNAVISKGSEVTPLEALIQKLCVEARLPGGWWTCVAGGGETAEALIDLRPDKIFFIGSTATGRKIMARASANLIPVELELGGKDSMIVFGDVDVRRTVAGALWGAVTNTGQSCTSVERLLVQESIYPEFRAELLARAATLECGQDYGRMTTLAQWRVVKSQVTAAVAEGARVLSPSILAWDEWEKDLRIPPIVIENVSGEAALWQEETFGPVIALAAFRDESEAVELANDTRYGLSASVWSKDLARARRVGSALRVGNVSVNNVMLTEANHALPFGGIGESGMGRYKGFYGFQAFSSVKAWIEEGASRKIEAHWYPYTDEKLRLFDGLTRGLFGSASGRLSLVRFARYGLAIEGLAARLWARNDKHTQ